MWWARPGDVRPWHVDLLDAAEQARRDRLRRRIDRDRFTVACALLRSAAGAHLQCAPCDVPLIRTCPSCGQPHGKPRLPEPDGLELSVSHSGDRVVVALSQDAPVGVDVEEVARLRDPDGVASHVLAPPESAWFSASPAEVAHRRRALLTYWIRKEAVVKATGEGLRVPLGHVVVSDPDTAPRLLAWQGREQAVQDIALYPLDAGADHVAALAVIDGGKRRVVVQLDGLALLGGPGPTA